MKEENKSDLSYIINTASDKTSAINIFIGRRKSATNNRVLTEASIFKGKERLFIILLKRKEACKFKYYTLVEDAISLLRKDISNSFRTAFCADSIEDRIKALRALRDLTDELSYILEKSFELDINNYSLENIKEISTILINLEKDINKWLNFSKDALKKGVNVN